MFFFWIPDASVVAMIFTDCSFWSILLLKSGIGGENVFRRMQKKGGRNSPS
jgi:hypothetical protein